MLSYRNRTVQLICITVFELHSNLLNLGLVIAPVVQRGHSIPAHFTLDHLRHSFWNRNEDARYSPGHNGGIGISPLLYDWNVCFHP